MKRDFKKYSKKNLNRMNQQFKSVFKNTDPNDSQAKMIAINKMASLFDNQALWDATIQEAGEDRKMLNVSGWTQVLDKDELGQVYDEMANVITNSSTKKIGR
jgi:uncharacterized pyridoxal phosphate-containing UPF0001 family protein